LEKAGVKTGDLGMAHDMMGMDGDTAMLEDADPLDRAFIDMVIPHQQGVPTRSSRRSHRTSSTHRSARSPR